MKRHFLFAFFFLLFSGALNAQTNEVMLETTEGNIRIMLYDDTPLHRDNFLKLVDEQFYDSLLFHRVIRNFMINPEHFRGA